MTQLYQGGEVLAEVVRSGFVESRHHGSVVVLGPDGDVVASVGDVDSPVFPRSANKPMQTVGALNCGLDVSDPADLAIGSASHRGEPFHIARVSALLEHAELTAQHLRCPSAFPTDDEARHAVLAAGGTATRLQMNCSGKHAAMLSTCVSAGLPLDSYLDPEHELQQSNRAAVEELTGEKVAAVGVDGCGAPLYAFSLTGLARAFGRLVDAPEGSRPRRVADAMRARPDLVSGTHGFDTKIMEAIPGLLAKSGAEAVQAVAIPGVGAIAVKVDDGSQRACRPVTLSALRTLPGIDVDGAVLDGLASSPVKGGNGTGGTKTVGEVRAVWPKGDA